MAKIYRLSDRIRLAVDDLEIVISPLSIHQKSAIEQAARDGDTASLMKASALAMRYALKDITGLEGVDGKKYELVFDETGEVSEDSVDDLFNIQASTKLTAVCLSLINNIPDEFFDPITGGKLEGVEFIVEKAQPGKKTKAASGN